MQKGHKLQFDCISCRAPVPFSIFELEDADYQLACLQCTKVYVLDDEDLKRQLRKFESLCRQLIESEEILASASVGIDIGDQQVKIPYKLLLTRLNSSIDLTIGDTPTSIAFRLEPTADIRS